MAMKPVAKKVLIVIGVVYVIVVIMMIVASRMGRLTVKEKLAVSKLHQALQAVDPGVKPDLAEDIYKERLAPRGAIIAFNYTLLLNLLNFGLLVALAYGLLWDPMLKFLDERSREVADNIRSAEKDRAGAAADREDAGRELEGARDERAESRSHARREAMEVRDEIVQKAREDARRLIERTELELEAAIESAKADLRAAIGDIACDIAARIIEREINPQDQEALVRQFLANLEKAEIG